jgi:iron only hydrogenase large subunit-like protein
MSEYEDLGRRLEKAALEGRLAEESGRAAREAGAAEDQDGAGRRLDALLHPEDKPLVMQFKACGCDPRGGKSPCEISCLFDAIRRDGSGNLVITPDCTGCGRCIEACDAGVLKGRKDAVPLLELLRAKQKPVYAMIAPAFSGQFSPEVTSGKLRTAFKSLGFYGMIEVALFADILTLKEALEFDRAINRNEDYLLTSCCCPMWMALIRKQYAQLIPHVPPSVSPMVACGRSIKKIHPEAVTVFIGPCLAKKAEAKEADIADAVDYVLTFDEVGELFDLAQLDLASLPEDRRDQSSRGGRIYARTSGVSEAVQTTLQRLRPGRSIPLRAEQADGIVACKELLRKISQGEIHANFIEGMGCKGGCVGGPRVLIDKEKARDYVNRYGDEATSRTPAENENVLDILHRLGFTTVESLLDRDNTFTREFK